MIDTQIEAHSMAELHRDAWRVIGREVWGAAKWKRLFTPTEWRRWEVAVSQGQAIQCTGGVEGARIVYGKMPRRRG